MLSKPFSFIFILGRCVSKVVGRQNEKWLFVL